MGLCGNLAFVAGETSGGSGVGWGGLRWGEVAMVKMGWSWGMNKSTLHFTNDEQKITSP